MSTGHANSAKDMLDRITTMVLMAENLPIVAVRNQIASGVDIVVHLGRQFDSCRRVLEIDEVIGVNEEGFIINPLYKSRYDEDRFVLEKTENSLMNTWKMEAANNGL